MKHYAISLFILSLTVVLFKINSSLECELILELRVNSASPSIASNIQLLCREFVDLLKTTERCHILLSRFIPAYHHHFGRQCRVADYGYTRLVDLLESQIVSNVIQVNFVYVE